MSASIHARSRSPALRQALALLVLCLFGMMECQPGNEPARENYVSIRLDDSLKRYDSVEIRILAAGDTAKVIGTVWAGHLANPSGIQDYRLPDGESGPLAVNVRGFDDEGRLLLDLMISKPAGQQVVEHLPVPKPVPTPSVRLSNLQCSPGTLIPAFDSIRSEYVVSLANSESTLVITAVPNHAQALMTLGTASLASGKASVAMPLKVGANDFSLRVSVGKESAAYTVKAIRSAYVPPDRVPPDTVHPDTTHPDTVLHPADPEYKTWKHGSYVNVKLGDLGLPEKTMELSFPLLVRLTDRNFNFSQASPAGQDIRFVQGGKTLAYEISRWDTTSAGHSADIWVKVDSLPGTADTVMLNMYWGNASATAASDGARVFGAEAGFSGAWHMSEPGRGNTGEYRDASGRYDGTGGNGDSKAAPTRVEGVVGHGQDFHAGKRQGTIALPNTFDPGSDSWTFQAWVQPRGYTNGAIFQKSDSSQTDKQRFQILCQGEGGNQIVIAHEGDAFHTEIYLPTDRFTLLSVVYTSGMLEVYSNGISFGSRAWTQGARGTARTVIGALTMQGDQGGFNGVLDEFWFTSKPAFG